METFVSSAKAAAVAVGVIADVKEPKSSPKRSERSFKRRGDDEANSPGSSGDGKVDEMAVGMLAELVVQVDHNGVPYSRNTKWKVLAQTMHLARWSPAMVEAALKGVKKLSKTPCSKDHIGVMRFYNQMLWSGKEKAVKVICSPKHSMRLEKCTHKTKDAEMKNVSKTLQQLLADWIEMFDAFHSCEVRLDTHPHPRAAPLIPPPRLTWWFLFAQDFYGVQRRLTFLSHPNRCSVAVARPQASDFRQRLGMEKYEERDELGNLCNSPAAKQLQRKRELEKKNRLGKAVEEVASWSNAKANRAAKKKADAAKRVKTVVGGAEEDQNDSGGIWTPSHAAGTGITEEEAKQALVVKHHRLVTASPPSLPLSLSASA